MNRQEFCKCWLFWFENIAFLFFALVAVGLEIEGIRRCSDLEIRHFANETPERIQLFGDLALLDVRLVFLADEPDAREIGFIIDDENSPPFEIRVIRVEELEYPLQILRLFLGYNYEFAALLALSELPRLLHDVENQDFIFIDKLAKIAAEASHSLSRHRPQDSLPP